MNIAPQVFTRLGHTVAGYLHHVGISVIPYLDDWLVHHPDCQVSLCNQSQLLSTLDLVGIKLNGKKFGLDLVQDIQFLGMRLCLDLGRALLPGSKEVAALACKISFLPISSVISTSVPVHGFMQLGLGFLPFGSSTPEATTVTLSFFRPDKPVYITASVRPIGPCQTYPGTYWQDPSFLISGIPIWPFQADFTIFTDAHLLRDGVPT